MNEFKWEFGSGSYIVIYKNDFICAHFNYDARSKIHVAWTTGHLYQDEWDGVLACVKEAKTILKKLKRI